MTKQGLNDITVIIVNYRTYALTRKAAKGIRAFYPKVRLLLIDNGSDDDSTRYIKSRTEQDSHTESMLNATNRYHGPAMDQGIRFSTTPFVFTMDSDCEVRHGGFLEQMLACFENPKLYAIGHLMYMDKYGFAKEASAPQSLTPYVHPHAMLLDREKYLSLPPFTHHGSPCLQNMKAAHKRAYDVRNFPIQPYILHHGRGTCSRYGYGLSVKTLLEKVLSTIGI